MNRPSYLLFKQCSKCGEIKHISKFYKDKNRKYGVMKICKECNIPSCLKFDFSRLGAYLLNRRTDGSSEIVSQDVEDGIPFASFTDALNASLINGYKLNDYLDHGNC